MFFYSQWVDGGNDGDFQVTATWLNFSFFALFPLGQRLAKEVLFFGAIKL